jgi:hypothetical protein
VETVCSSYSVQFSWCCYLMLLSKIKRAKNKFCRTALHYAEDEKYEKIYLLFQVTSLCLYWFVPSFHILHLNRVNTKAFSSSHPRESYHHHLTV